MKEFSYAYFSLYDPRVFYTMKDFMYNLWALPTFWGSYETVVKVLLIIILYFAITSFVQDGFLYITSQFPEDKTFRKNFRMIKRSNFLYKVFHFI